VRRVLFDTGVFVYAVGGEHPYTQPCQAILRERRVERSCPLHGVDRADVKRALDLWCDHDQLDMRDAIFAAQAANRQIDAILSPDPGFDGTEGLQRIDPADAPAVASLVCA
jgi:predicted nucleic acid-binding protein